MSEQQSSADSAVEGRRDAIVQLIHKHVGIRQRVNVDLTGVEDAADAILRNLTEPQTAPSDIERAFRDACDEAGCAYDNEALLEAIHALKERCQAEIVPVPKAALDWLFGEGAGPDGKWFCDDQDTEQRTPRKYSRAYWWRSKFRSMIPALTRPLLSPTDKANGGQS